MPANPFLLFYDEFSQQPAGNLSRLPGLRTAGNLSRLADSLDDKNLVFLQAGGKLRQDAVKLLLKEKKSFVLSGLEPADLSDTERLQSSARKKHLQICWLGSLRFHQAVARLKELLSGGCLGEIQDCQFCESANSPWEPYQIQDLLLWLLPEPKISLTRQPESNTADFSLQIKATCGSAAIALNKNQPGCFRVTHAGRPEKLVCCPDQSAAAELGLLLLHHRMEQAWTMLAKPWECKR